MQTRYKQVNGDLLPIEGEELEALLASEADTEPFEIMVRERRDALLSETDWWCLSDRTATQAQLDYRQALRDVTDQAGFPNTITWPAKP